MYVFLGIRASFYSMKCTPVSEMSGIQDCLYTLSMSLCCCILFVFRSSVMLLMCCQSCAGWCLSVTCTLLCGAFSVVACVDYVGHCVRLWNGICGVTSDLLYVL